MIGGRGYKNARPKAAHSCIYLYCDWWCITHTVYLRYTSLMKRFLSAKHYLSVLRRQSEHVQHMSALLFAGVMTLLIAVAILYFDYGMWRDTYTRGEQTEEVPSYNDDAVTVQSPGHMIGSFLKEASTKLRDIDLSNTVQGKESYSRTEE